MKGVFDKLFENKKSVDSDIIFVVESLKQLLKGYIKESLGLKDSYQLEISHKIYSSNGSITLQKIICTIKEGENTCEIEFIPIRDTESNILNVHSDARTEIDYYIIKPNQSPMDDIFNLYKAKKETIEEVVMNILKESDQRLCTLLLEEQNISSEITVKAKHFAEIWSNGAMEDINHSKFNLEGFRANLPSQPQHHFLVLYYRNSRDEMQVSSVHNMKDISEIGKVFEGKNYINITLNFGEDLRVGCVTREELKLCIEKYIFASFMNQLEYIHA